MLSAYMPPGAGVAVLDEQQPPAAGPGALAGGCINVVPWFNAAQSTTPCIDQSTPVAMLLTTGASEWDDSGEDPDGLSSGVAAGEVFLVERLTTLQHWQLPPRWHVQGLSRRETARQDWEGQCSEATSCAEQGASGRGGGPCGVGYL